MRSMAWCCTAGVSSAAEFERQLLADLRRYSTALRRLISTVVYALLVVLLTAAATRLLATCLLLRLHTPRDPPGPRDDDVTLPAAAARPATIAVNAQTRRTFTVSKLRFSETKV